MPSSQTPIPQDEETSETRNTKTIISTVIFFGILIALFLLLGLNGSF